MVNYDPIKVFSEGTPDPMIIYAVKNNNLLSFQWTKKTVLRLSWMKTNISWNVTTSQPSMNKLWSFTPTATATHPQ